MVHCCRLFWESKFLRHHKAADKCSGLAVVRKPCRKTTRPCKKMKELANPLKCHVMMMVTNQKNFWSAVRLHTHVQIRLKPRLACHIDGMPAHCYRPARVEEREPSSLYHDSAVTVSSRVTRPTSFRQSRAGTRCKG